MTVDVTYTQRAVHGSRSTYGVGTVSMIGIDVICSLARLGSSWEAIYQDEQQLKQKRATPMM